MAKAMIAKMMRIVHNMGVPEIGGRQDCLPLSSRAPLNTRSNLALGRDEQAVGLRGDEPEAPPLGRRGARVVVVVTGFLPVIRQRPANVWTNFGEVFAFSQVRMVGEPVAVRPSPR